MTTRSKINNYQQSVKHNQKTKDKTENEFHEHQELRKFERFDYFMKKKHSCFVLLGWNDIILNGNFLFIVVL